MSIFLNNIVSVFDNSLSALKILCNFFNALLFTDIKQEKLVDQEIHAL